VRGCVVGQAWSCTQCSTTSLLFGHTFAVTRVWCVAAAGGAARDPARVPAGSDVRMGRPLLSTQTPAPTRTLARQTLQTRQTHP
jgi:hypothetical protein